MSTEQLSIFTQAEMPVPQLTLPEDVYVVLLMFQNWGGGKDFPRTWQALSQKYHSVYVDEDAPKSTWSSKRLQKALEDAEARGFIEEGSDHYPYPRNSNATEDQKRRFNCWYITASGIAARDIARAATKYPR